jgi:hypothetical protein
MALWFYNTGVPKFFDEQPQLLLCGPVCGLHMYGYD